MLNENIKEILLVDDDSDECMLFELALEEINPAIKLTHSCTCNAGLKELEDCKPDLIFLDIKLDTRTGHDCLKELKASARLCDIPVVVYSNSHLPKDILFSYQLGASLYFKKTSSFPELVRALKHILSMPWHNPQELQKKYYSDEGYFTYQEEVE